MISETNLSAKLYPQYTTVQDTLSNPNVNPNIPGNAAPAPSGSPVFLFVLDTCMIEEEFGFVKSALKRAIGLLPDNAHVGFVSFGTQAQVHELGFSDMSKVYVFRGNKEISKDQIMEQLGLGVSGRRAPVGYPQKGMQNGFPILGITRFLLPLLDELQTDQWHKDALKVEIDEHNPDNYLVSFVFDALLDGSLEGEYRRGKQLFLIQITGYQLSSSIAR